MLHLLRLSIFHSILLYYMHHNDSSDCFEYPKKPYLIQASQKNSCQFFLPPKNPFIIPVN